jgi:septum formation inhibitor-activating ATPase MinD
MRFRETQVIVFANQKGGCGKTSSTISTAAAFAGSWRAFHNADRLVEMLA